MSISSSQGDVYTDISSLKGLKHLAAKDSSAAIEKVAEQFEALFLQSMLKSMRKTMSGDSIMDNDQSRLYQEMFDQQIAIDLAKKRQAGIADAILSQLGKQNPQTESNDTDGLIFEQARLHRPISSVAIQAFAPPPGFARETIKGFDSPEDYVEKLMPLAEKYSKELGVEPRVLLAQSALETGWGKHVIRYSNGVNTHNLFNIKADGRWDGPRAVVPTLEYDRGRPVSEYAAFRSYPNFEASFADYVDFLKSSPRYQQALGNVGDSPAFVKALHAAGYATDPKYSQKINKIMSNEVMGGVSGSLKNPVEQPLT